MALSWLWVCPLEEGPLISNSASERHRGRVGESGWWMLMEANPGGPGHSLFALPPS